MSDTTYRKATKLDAGLDHPEEVLNTAMDNFDLRDAKTAISVTTTNVTMTQPQQLCGVWEVTGLTAPRQLIINATLGSTHTPVVYNNSSYDLTVKTNAAGSNRSVVVKAGNARLLRHDNTHVDDAITEKGEVAPSITAPSLLNSWSNYGSPYEDAGYVLHNGEVVVCGSVHSGTVNTTLFTLPVGYRPSKTRVFPASSNSTHCYIEVHANGDVVQFNGSNAFLSLDSVRFIPV